VNEARATGSHVWAINGLVFQAHAELKLNGKLDAKNSIKEAIELAQELKDETIIASLVVVSNSTPNQLNTKRKSNKIRHAEMRHRLQFFYYRGK